MSITPTKIITKRTVLLSHLMELHFDSLTQVVENPIFLDWNEEFNITIKDLKINRLCGEGSSGEIYQGMCLFAF